MIFAITNLVGYFLAQANSTSAFVYSDNKYSKSLMIDFCAFEIYFSSIFVILHNNQNFAFSFRPGAVATILSRVFLLLLNYDFHKAAN